MTKMDSYWEVIDKEGSLIRESYESNVEIYDLAISAWENSIVHKYFKDFHDDAALLVMYKTQADVALMRAITSVLKKEYSQAIYNIRYAAENLVIAIFAYAQPDELPKILATFKDPDQDSKIKKAANKFLASKLPTRSAKFKGLHQTCDKFGSHQALSHHSSHFDLDDVGKEFRISLQGKDKQELNVALTGIVVGSILEFHFAITELEAVRWAKVDRAAINNMKTASEALDKMKAKYLYLFLKMLV